MPEVYTNIERLLLGACHIWHSLAVVFYYASTVTKHFRPKMCQRVGVSGFGMDAHHHGLDYGPF